MTKPSSNPCTAASALASLRGHADPKRAASNARFFQTGAGGYAEGDRFLGVTVPQVRAVEKVATLPLDEIEALVRSEWHEARLLAVLLYAKTFRAKKAKHESDADVEARRKAVYESYLAHTSHIDNWDLVDSSAEHVVGGYLAERSRAPLRKLARSHSLWERRIAMLATFHLLKRGEAEDTLAIATLLLHDEHDLIHKAVGWMLRELGKRVSEAELRAFLDAHAAEMPRTMLRYGIERFPAEERARYLAVPRVARPRRARPKTAV